MFNIYKRIIICRYYTKRCHGAIIGSEPNKSDQNFQNNKANMNTLVEELRRKTALVIKGGSDFTVKRHITRGKQLVRDRINKLVDKGSDVLELSTLAANSMYKDEVPCAAIVTAVVKIHGRHCVLIANDPTVKGGAYFPMTLKKHIRAQRIALVCRLPCIYLIESAGVHLPDQADLVVDKEHFGTTFWNQAKMSSKGIAQITVVFGSSTAAGAYIPCMSDENIIVKAQGTLFLAGPPLVKAATGESIGEQDLGGAELHCRESGVTDHFAENEDHAIQLTRDIVATLNTKVDQSAFDVASAEEEPLFDPEDLHGIVGTDIKHFFDMREVIARIVDGSQFHEFKKLFGTTLVCGFAKFYGRAVGILGNNGVLDSDSSLKGTHFVQLCASRKIPLIFLQNITGFMVGREAEISGIGKNGSKMMNAVICYNGPKITIVVGASFGAGIYAMCGRGIEPTFMFAWPNSRVGTMGIAQAGTLMSLMAREKAKKSGQLWTKEDELKVRAPIEAQFERECNAYYATARLWDDGIIAPKDTRKVIGLCLSASQNIMFENTNYAIFRM